MATMIGMALGMLLARLTIGNAFAIWFSFLSLTTFHMYEDLIDTNYKAVCCLALTSLNFQRISILLQHFMETDQVLSPEQVSTMEHVLPIPTTSWRSKNSKLLHLRVDLGLRISSLDQPEMMDLLDSAKSLYMKAKYLLIERKGIIGVIVHKESTATEVLQSYIHALVMANLTDGNKSIHLESQSWIEKKYEVFVQKLKSTGWKTERLLSPSIVWRANWKYGASDKKIE